MTLTTFLAIISLLILMYLGYGILTQESKRKNILDSGDNDDPPNALPEANNNPIETIEKPKYQPAVSPPPPTTTPPAYKPENKPPAYKTENKPPAPPPKPPADPPISFGANRLWMAIRTTDQKQIAQLLELENLHTATWYEGLEERSPAEGGIFVTPPIDGWTLVVGWGFMADTLTDTIDIGKKLIAQFSAKFGETQYFCSHTRADYHCWMRAINGNVERAYAWLGEEGENLIVEGNPTAAEPRRLVDTLSPDAQKEDYFAQEDLVYPNLELVLHIASKWSINPNILHKRTDIKGLGLFGD